MCFDHDDINESLSRWNDMFFAAVDQHIPKCKARNTNDYAWIDSEVRHLIKNKDKQRRKAMKTHKSNDWDKYKCLRRQLKTLMKKKRIEHAEKLISNIYNGSGSTLNL